MVENNKFSNFARIRNFKGLQFDLFAIAGEQDDFFGLTNANDELSRRYKIQAKQEYKYVRRIKNEYDCVAIYVRERLN